MSGPLRILADAFAVVFAVVFAVLRTEAQVPRIKLTAPRAHS
jgi:hypothetical protein